MPVSTINGSPVWRRHTMRERLMIWARWLAGALLFIYCFQIISENTEWMFVEDAGRQGLDLASRMVPPKWDYLSVILVPLWDTLSIATLGTLFSVIISVPVAFLAARNTTPSVLVARPIALFIIVSSRSINSLIWALLLVQIFGIGIFAGILAITLRSVGFVSKLLYEAIEEIDAAQVEAITATGASGPQKLLFGIVPQIMPAFAGISVYRWDINIRESTVVGWVGAGGIGLQLKSSVDIIAWNQVTLIILAILATVVVSEWISAKVRHSII